MPDFADYLPDISSFANYLPPQRTPASSRPAEIPATGTGDLITSSLMSGFHGAVSESARALQAIAQGVGAPDAAQYFSDAAEAHHATERSYARPDLEADPWSVKGFLYQVGRGVPMMGAALLGGTAAAAAAPEVAGAGLLGGAATMFLPAAGGNVQRQIDETGELTSPGTALALGVPEAFVQGWLPGRVESYFGKGIMRGIAHGIATQGGAASATEFMTQLMGDPNRSVADRASAIIEQGLAGGVLGGVIGGAAGGMRKLAGKPTADVLKDPEALKGSIDQSLGTKAPPAAAAEVPPAAPSAVEPAAPPGAPAVSVERQNLAATLQGMAVEAGGDRGAAIARIADNIEGYGTWIDQPPETLRAAALVMERGGRPGTADVFNTLADAAERLRTRGGVMPLMPPVAEPAPAAPAAAPAAEAPPAAPVPPAAAEPVVPGVPREEVAPTAMAPGEPPVVGGAPAEPPAAAEPPVAPAPALDFTARVTEKSLKAGMDQVAAASPEAQAAVKQNLIDTILARGDKPLTKGLTKWGDKLDIWDELEKQTPERPPAPPGVSEPVLTTPVTSAVAPVASTSEGTRYVSNWDSTGGTTTDFKYVLKHIGEPEKGGVAGENPLKLLNTTSLGTMDIGNGKTAQVVKRGNYEVAIWAKGEDIRGPRPASDPQRPWLQQGWDDAKDTWYKIGTAKKSLDKTGPQAGALEHVVVAPSFQRQGFGTKLVELAQRELNADPFKAKDISPAGAGLLNRVAAPPEAAPTVPTPVDHVAELKRTLGTNEFSAVLDRLKNDPDLKPRDIAAIANEFNGPVSPGKPRKFSLERIQSRQNKLMEFEPDTATAPAPLARDTSIETPDGRVSVLSEVQTRLGKIPDPAVKDPLANEAETLIKLMPKIENNPGLTAIFDGRLARLRTKAEDALQRPADAIASPDLAPLPRAEAVSAPTGDLGERIGDAQSELSNLAQMLRGRSKTDPNVAAAFKQYAKWLADANQAVGPEAHAEVLARDPEKLAADEVPGAADLGGIKQLSKPQERQMAAYIAAHERVLQELRAQSGPDSRARVVASRDGLPVNQLDADVADMHQRGVPLADQMGHIAENHADPEQAAIAAKLQDALKALPHDVNTGFRDDVLDKEGEYFPKTKTSMLYNAGNAAITAMHEAVHAVTHWVLDGTSAAAKALRGIYDQLKTRGDHYGLTDVHEMMSEFYSNPTYREWTKSQFVQGTSLWDRIVDMARGAIGLDPRLYSAFDRIMSHGDDVLKMRETYPNEWVGPDSYASVSDKGANDTATAADTVRDELTRRLEGGRLNTLDAIRNGVFGFLNSQRFAPLYGRFAPSIPEKIALEQKQAALGMALARPTQLADRISGVVHGDERTNLNKVMNDSAYFRFDPRKALADYPEIHDNPDLVNRFNENQLRYNSLSDPAKAAYEAQRAIGSMNIHALMALRLQSVMRAVGMPVTDAFDVYRNNDRLWNDPRVAENYFKDAVTNGIKTLTDYRNQQSADLATAKAAIKAGLPDDQLEKMTAQRNDLQANINKIGNVLGDVKQQQIEAAKAPYFHLGRIGDKFLTAKFITDDDGNVDQGKLSQFMNHLEKAGFKDIVVNAGGENDTFYTRVKNASELDLLRQTIQDAQAKGLLSKDGAAWGEGRTMYSTLSRNTYEHVVEELLAHRMEPPEGLSEELVDNWKKATGHQAEELRRTLLNLMPENSMGRQLAQRRNVQGYNSNMLESNTTASKIMTRGLANMAFAPDMGAVSARMLDDVKNVNRTQDTNTALAVGQAVNELMLRDQIRQTSYTPLGIADALHRFTHTIHIGLSPPYVFMLMSQLMTTAWPELAKSHGLGAAATSLFKVEGDAFRVIKAIMASPDRATVGVSRDALEKAGVNPTRIDQVMRAVSNGVLDTAMYSTQAHEQGPLSFQNKKSLEVANAMGKYAELFPRLSTLFAAHDLYDAKPVNNPITRQPMTAEDFAHNAVTESQGDWTPGLSARQTSRGGIAGRLSPLALQFMGWRVIMTGKMYNEVRNLYRGDDRAGATRWLIGHGAATTMLAGTLGLPALSIAAGVYDQLMDWVTNRDDHDLTASYRSFLSDTFGKDMGEIIARGLPRAVGMDLPRLSEADIIPGSSVVQFATEKRKLEDRERDWAKSLVGPAVGDLVNMVAAARDITNGDILNGMIKMSPEVLKAPAEAYRLEQRGFVNNLTGQKLPLGTPNTFDIMMTALGIDPAKQAEYQEVTREAAGLKTMRQLNSENIVRHLEQAYTRGDHGMMQTWMGEAQKWQVDHPGLVPPQVSFGRELQNHMRQSAYARGAGLPVGVEPRDIGARGALRYGNIPVQ